MDDLEVEISQIKSGELSESKAIVVAKNRGIQLKAVELILQAARIEARFRPAQWSDRRNPETITEVQ